MRILSLDINAQYHNPTRTLMPRMLEQCAETIFFGPGFVSSGELKLGLSAFISKSGPFDFIVSNEHFAWVKEANLNNLARGYRSNYIMGFPLEDLTYLPKIFKDFLSLPQKKIFTTLESDYYNFSPEQISIVKSNFDLIVGWSNQFVRPISELQELNRESFSAKANDNWANFSNDFKKRFIPFHHFVSDDEFNYIPLSIRKSDWSIPGTRYAKRSAAFKFISESEYTLSKKIRVPWAGLLSRIGLKPFTHRTFVNYYQESFRNEIKNSCFSYTCGSGLKYPLRKFFEIPALGSVLVCSPCSGFDGLGFKNGINSIIAEPNNVIELGKFLSKDLDYAQTIANAGRKLINDNHTVLARSKQLRSALDSFSTRNWFGGEWIDGKLVALRNA